VMLPALRIGFIVLPPDLRYAVRAAKYVADWHSSEPVQAALATFIDDGDLSRHLRRAGRAYRARRDRITAALTGPLSPWLSLIPAVAGLHVSAHFRDDVDLDGLHARLREADVAVWDFAGKGLMFGFGAIPTDRVEEGLRRLRACLK
jgi:GntR family transcriptional regulator/MocR family aminotransferase